MPAPLVVPSLPPAVRETLQRLRRRGSTPQRQAQRIAIILELTEGPSARAVACRLGIHDKSARRWFRAIPDLLAPFQEGQPPLTPRQMEKRVLTCLKDKPRPGAPATYEPEQICQIISLATEDPQESKRPISHWTARELADEANHRAITKNISARSVGRFLEENDLRPHKIRYWLNKKKGIRPSSRPRSNPSAKRIAAPSPLLRSAVSTPSP